MRIEHSETAAILANFVKFEYSPRVGDHIFLSKEIIPENYNPEKTNGVWFKIVVIEHIVNREFIDKHPSQITHGITHFDNAEVVLNVIEL